MSFLMLKEKCKKIRVQILQMARSATIKGKGSHLGGSLSIVELLATLYFSDAANIKDQEDYFVLSKGHAALALYVTLSMSGKIDIEEIHDYPSDESSLLGHPLRDLTKGIIFSTGSLGIGHSLAAGLALSKKLKGIKSRIYSLVGDGECSEGIIWETANFTIHHNLVNLITIIDKNKFQQTGSTEEIGSPRDLHNIFSSIGFLVIQVDGHSIEDLYSCLKMTQDVHQPVCIIINTIKGKGLKDCELDNKWHHSQISEELFIKFQDELN